jgi:hypothetical protein
VQPTFRLDEGLPPYALPPSIDPAFSNGNAIDYWQGQEATRAPENLFWTFTMQRQMADNTVLEVGYNANVGTHLQTGLLNYNQVPTNVYNDLVAALRPTQANNIMRADINSALARKRGHSPALRRSFATQRLRTVAHLSGPIPSSRESIPASRTATRAATPPITLSSSRPTAASPAALPSSGATCFSKLLTDSDTYFANAAGAQDHYNRSLEKSIGANDQTHVFKFSTLYDLPFGKGRRWIQQGFLTHLIGGWRLAGIQIYSSGLPIALQRNNPLPMFNSQARPVIDSYDNWRAPLVGSEFDPNVDRFLKPANQFPAQPAHLYGNATRFNPKLRGFWNSNENISLAKTFQITESFRVDLRGEAFNLFNRTVFGTGSANLNAGTFGIVQNQVNTPRQVQVGLKVYW